jgi:hypothetical protein
MLLMILSFSGKAGEKQARVRVCKRLRSPGIDSEESIPPGWELIPGLLKVYKYGLWIWQTNKGKDMGLENRGSRP